jgi:hypothetical protein
MSDRPGRQPLAFLARNGDCYRREVGVTRLVFAVSVVVVLVGCTGPDTAGPATWTLEPGEVIGPDTTAFIAWVTELDCASGQSSEGRIIGPEIVMSSEKVVVSFYVRPLGGWQRCPSNPASGYKVRLPESLGNHQLLDGGREPPVEPPVCANLPFCE